MVVARGKQRNVLGWVMRKRSDRKSEIVGECLEERNEMEGKFPGAK